MTWQGWMSLPSTVATTLSTPGRIQGNELALRVLMLSSAPLCATHDLLVGSLPGLLAELRRLEIEYPISVLDADALLSLRTAGLIEKTRFTVRGERT